MKRLLPFLLLMLLAIPGDAAKFKGLRNLRADAECSLCDGLLDYYTFDSVHTDSIGGLTLANLIFSLPGFITGRIGNGVNFTGGNFYYGHTDHANYSLGNSISKSWSYWFYSRANNYTISHINQDSDLGAPGWEFYVDTDDKMLARIYQNAGSSTAKSTTSVSLNNWHHVVVTYDSATTTLKLYLDNANEATTTGVSNGRDSTEDFIVGADGGGTAGDFIIDELGIWNRALSGDDVRRLYNLGNGARPSNVN